jgi:hypothetical protein
MGNDEFQSYRCVIAILPKVPQMKRFLSSVLAAAILAAPASAIADDVTDTLDAVRSAYDEGDIARALEELKFAEGMLQARRAEGLKSFLPEPPEGWTREINTDMSGPMLMAGGGVGAEAQYSNGTDNFTVTMMADSPMIGMMSSVLSNPVVAMAQGAEVTRMGDVKLVSKDGELSGMIGDRVLVQATGASNEVMMPILKLIDIEGLENFNP